MELGPSFRWGDSYGQGDCMRDRSNYADSRENVKYLEFFIL